MQLPKSATIEEQLFVTIGDEIDQASAEGLVYQLRAAGHVTDREARIIAAAMARESLMVALPTRDAIRAKLLRAMLIAVLTSERKGGGVR
jgi:transcriptional regulator CtsR